RTEQRNCFLKTPYYSANYFWKEEAHNTKKRCRKKLRLFLSIAAFPMCWRICIILAMLIQKLLTKRVKVIFIPKFLFYLLGKKFIKPTMSVMRILNKHY